MEESNYTETEFGPLVHSSQIGGRKENQDYAGYIQTSKGLLLVVCDGMGGARGGKMASKLATESILLEFENNKELPPADLLVVAFKKANQTVYNTSLKNPELQGMGTTGTALFIDKDKAIAAHTGDSRIYQIRKGKKIFRTFDHSMVFELVKRGTLSEEQARLSAESNVILRALGTKPDIDVEISPELTYKKGDFFLLCSDGISGALPEKEILQLLSQKKNIRQLSQQLSTKVNNVGMKQGGAHDNLTSSLIQLKHNSSGQKSQKKLLLPLMILLIAILSLALYFFIWKKDPAIPDKKIQTVTVDKLSDRINKSLPGVYPVITSLTINKNLCFQDKKK